MHLGKDESTWVCAEGVDPPTLGNMGTLNRLNDGYIE
jgi:hypothetical protein